jgi:hypothetical protein
MTFVDTEPDLIVYAYSPRLYAALQADVHANDLGSLLRWRDELVNIAAVLTDVDQRLPEFGLTLPRLVELVQHAWDAENAASVEWEGGPHHEPGEFRLSEALSPAMNRAIVNLHLRGMSDDLIAGVLTVHPAWVAHALAMANLDGTDRAVVAGHVAGKNQSTIAAETGTPRTTVARIIGSRLGEEARTRSHQAAARRRREVRRLKAAGRSVSEICKLLDLPKHTVLYDLADRGRRGPAE